VVRGCLLPTRGLVRRIFEFSIIGSIHLLTSNTLWTQSSTVSNNTEYTLAYIVECGLDKQ